MSFFSNFDFGAILDRFENKTRFLVLLVLSTIIIAWAVAVPITKAYFSSDHRDCTKCLEQNQLLTDKIIEVNALYVEYVHTHTMNEVTAVQNELALAAVELEQRNSYQRLEMPIESTPDTMYPPAPPISRIETEEIAVTSTVKVVKNDSLKQREKELMRDIGKVLNEAQQVKD